MARPRYIEKTARTDSGFQKKGGYASPKTPVTSLPKVPAGPAPDASPKASTGSGQENRAT